MSENPSAPELQNLAENLVDYVSWRLKGRNAGSNGGRRKESATTETADIDYREVAAYVSFFSTHISAAPIRFGALKPFVRTLHSRLPAGTPDTVERLLDECQTRFGDAMPAIDAGTSHAYVE